MRTTSQLLSLGLLLSACAAPEDAAEPSEAPTTNEPTTVRPVASRQDRLRGSITREREWWDLLHYDLELEVMPDTKSIEGTNTITFRALAPGQRLQLDLQPPLEVTRVVHAGAELAFEREGNVYWVDLAAPLAADAEAQLAVSYGGTPVESESPPWSGGFTWTTDDLGRPFIATTCQGIGASIWWPNKDHGYDEPDRGVDVRVTVPRGLVAVSNGRLVERAETTSTDGRPTEAFHWRVTNPINNYSVNVNIGTYVSLPDTFEGEAGTLDLEYWVLDHQVEQARAQFQEVPRTLAAFEHWFGPYPFYEDSFKLVVVPYLGMEHQSSVTYGNGFQNGYRGTDLSNTGVGLLFDFIVVHEAAHEWWGNNVTSVDVADLWIHESFANYAENLFVEHHFSEEQAQTYVIGCRAQIANDRPIIAPYGVHAEGSKDMYYKGGNLLHTMRHALGDDELWRATLRGLNERFRHRTVTTEELETYVCRATGVDFRPVFEQYLRTAELPLLRHEPTDDGLRVWFERVVPGFELSVVLWLDGEARRVTVSEEPRALDLGGPPARVELDRNVYVDVAGG